ncbi:hypothetical protein [Paenibacillus sp. S150]|uniref:hypothetical protein n=1 Tax=Paenibacillus sp. S150 TaxID=2749826 RepID=UPI001C56FBF0|nr:hypothetical protein [Paenibacillus sp. S150]MBW4081287.1 hypothetical protein [Paenibacillus sp. S150]
MGRWRYTVTLGLESLLDDESTTVEQKGWMIAERLDREACFHSFPERAAFRMVRDTDKLDQLLARMYDYADRYRIWIA